MASNLDAETVGSVLAVALARGGDRVAARSRREVRTYRQLLENASRLAHALAANGLGPGDRVALMLEDRIEALEAYLGCFLGGFCPVHVNDRLQSVEVAAIAADADARAFIHTDGLGPVIDKVSGIGGPDGITSVVIGDNAPGDHRYADLIASGSTAPPRFVAAPTDLAIVGYTSGTTGTPKGVAHTQQNVLRIMRHIPVHFSLLPGNRAAYIGTFSFVTSIWGVMLPNLYLGGELSFMAGLDPDAWFDAMIEQGSQFTYVPSPLAPEFIAQVKARPQILQTVTSAVHSGSIIRPDLARELVELLGPRYMETYGMTETGSPVTRTVPSDWTAACAADDIFASAGRPVHIAEIVAHGPDGAVQPAGETGELAVRADTLFAGYFNAPDRTAEAMRGDWLRTGDIGRVDDAGYVYITDRLKDMIVTGGMNVYPAEVEQALAQLPGVAAVAVYGVPDERWGETVVASIVPTPGAELDEQAVIAWARGRLASYKKPTAVRFAPLLPRTSSMKVDKPRLRAEWSNPAPR